MPARPTLRCIRMQPASPLVTETPSRLIVVMTTSWEQCSQMIVQLAAVLGDEKMGNRHVEMLAKAKASKMNRLGPKGVSPINYCVRRFPGFSVSISSFSKFSMFLRGYILCLSLEGIHCCVHIEIPMGLASLSAAASVRILFSPTTPHLNPSFFTTP